MVVVLLLPALYGYQPGMTGLKQDTVLQYQVLCSTENADRNADSNSISKKNADSNPVSKKNADSKKKSADGKKPCRLAGMVAMAKILASWTFGAWLACTTPRSQN